MSDVIRAEPGEYIGDFCKRVTKIARTHTLTIEHNGTQIEVQPNEDPGVIEQRWWTIRRKREEAQEAHASKIKQLGDALLAAALALPRFSCASTDRCHSLVGWDKRSHPDGQDRWYAFTDARDAYEEALRSLSVEGVE